MNKCRYCDAGLGLHEALCPYRSDAKDAENERLRATVVEMKRMHDDSMDCVLIECQRLRTQLGDARLYHIREIEKRDKRITELERLVSVAREGLDYYANNCGCAAGCRHCESLRAALAEMGDK